uniref:Uncharacterized protein n=1 Tax=Anguilla anguilla TaxID=7936 RepID=A0A0E9XPN7_ANGAN
MQFSNEAGIIRDYNLCRTPLQFALCVIRPIVYYRVKPYTKVSMQVYTSPYQQPDTSALNVHAMTSKYIVWCKTMPACVFKRPVGQCLSGALLSHL